MRQLVMDTGSGIVLSGFVSVTTVWLMVLTG